MYLWRFVRIWTRKFLKFVIAKYIFNFFKTHDYILGRYNVCYRYVRDPDSDLPRHIYIYICLLILLKHIFHSNSSVTLLTCTREGKTRANINTVLHNPSICILYIIYMCDILISRNNFIKENETYFYFVSSVISLIIYTIKVVHGNTSQVHKLVLNAELKTHAKFNFNLVCGWKVVEICLI